MRIGKSIVSGLMVIGLVVSLNACVVVVKGNSNGHARTQTSSSFQYWYYYPNSGVYYHVTEHYYYYPDGKKWRRARHLPDGWALDNTYRVRVKLTGKPYRHHALHKRKYPVKHREAREHENTEPGHKKNPLRGIGSIKPDGWPDAKNAKQKEDHKPDHANKGNGHDKHDNKHKRDHVDARKPTPPGHAKSKAASNKPHKNPQQAGKSVPHRQDHANNGKGNAVADKRDAGKRDKKQRGKPSHAKAGSPLKADRTKGNGKNQLPKTRAGHTAGPGNRTEHPAADKQHKKDHSKPSAIANAKDNSPTERHGQKPQDSEQKRHATKTDSKRHQVKAAGNQKPNEPSNSNSPGNGPNKKGKGKRQQPKDTDEHQARSDSENNQDQPELAANLPEPENKHPENKKGKGKHR